MPESSAKGGTPGMYDAGTALKMTAPEAAMQRVHGVARVGFSQVSGQTRLSDLYQKGSAKIRLPRVYGEPATAVLINTAGGLTGGDRIDCEAIAGEDTHAIVTTQAAERAYRSLGSRAEVRNRLTVQNGARLDWLPQETILFDHSGIGRCTDAQLSGNARLLLVETIVLGRAAMGETVDRMNFRDRWRIRRDGKLVFADDVRLDGSPQDVFSGPGTGAGSRALATFLDCCPQAEDRLAKARSALGNSAHPAVRAAASAWDGKLVARFVADDAMALKTVLMAFLESYRSADLPRVWRL